MGDIPVNGALIDSRQARTPLCPQSDAPAMRSRPRLELAVIVHG